MKTMMRNVQPYKGTNKKVEQFFSKFSERYCLPDKVKVDNGPDYNSRKDIKK